MGKLLNQPVVSFTKMKPFEQNHTMFHSLVTTFTEKLFWTYNLALFYLQ